MRCVKTTELKGNEYLAKQVFNEAQELLMGEGTILKKSYIDRLINHGVEYVVVDDEYEKRKKAREVRDALEKDIKNSVQGILEQHVFGNAKELQQLCTVAEEVMTDVVSNDDIAAEVAEIREHDADIYSHSVNISMLASMLATKDGFDEKTVKEIATGCLLHDIGLRYVTAEYVDVDLKEIPEKEAEEIKNHVIFGFDVLEKEEWMTPLEKEIIICHHERLDGNGFPFKYSGAHLSRATQIVSICDMFDRTICGLGCKTQSKAFAAKLVKESADKLVAKDVMDLFFKFVAIYPVGTVVKLSTGETGVVESQNPGNAEFPTIMVNVGPNGQITKPYKINLAENQDITIEEIKQ